MLCENFEEELLPQLFPRLVRQQVGGGGLEGEALQSGEAVTQLSDSNIIISD